MQWKFLNWLRQKSEGKRILDAEMTDLDSEDLRGSGRAPLSELAKQVKQIEISTKKNAELILSGQYKSRFRGQGMQFSDVRVYQYGDDVRHIDWRTSARSQQVYIKTFEEERELNIILAVDVSASNNFGSEVSNKRETLTRGLASIAFSAAANRDLVGLLLFTDKIERYIPPSKGRKHVLRILDELLNYQPVNRKTDINVALKAIPYLVRHTSVICLASDFNGPLSKNQLKRVARKHDVVAMFVSDPREGLLPSIGMIQVQDPETGKILLLDSSSTQVRAKFRLAQEAWQNSVEDMLRSSGASIISLSTNRDPTADLVKFFSARRKSRR